MSLSAFISHAREDSDFAGRLSRALDRSGVRIGGDTDMVPAGQLWENHLRQAIWDTSVVIAVMTPQAMQNALVMTEIGAALAARKPIISIIPPDAHLPPDLPAPLRDGCVIRAGSQTDDEVAAIVRGRLDLIGAQNAAD